MKKEYNFSGSVKNPYSKKLKKQISIRIEDDTVEYFKKLASEIGIPYQEPCLAGLIVLIFPTLWCRFVQHSEIWKL